MCIKVFDYKVILFITAILASSLIPTYQLQAQGLQISFEYLENRQIIRRDSLSELHKNNIDASTIYRKNDLICLF